MEAGNFSRIFHGSFNGDPNIGGIKLDAKMYVWVGVIFIFFVVLEILSCSAPTKGRKLQLLELEEP